MELQKLTEKEKMRLYHLLQKYLYEMPHFLRMIWTRKGIIPIPILRIPF